MTVLFDSAAILNNLIDEFGSSIYFIMITSLHGSVMKSYINEEEFNKASISLNISQLYELAEETTELIGLHGPDFNIIHSDNYYILTIKLLDRLIILLTVDQINVEDVFSIINKSINIET
jgi:predicted regulator of Ras-like GTPase activity (Roadblock/LC7/MglB family)